MWDSRQHLKSIQLRSPAFAPKPEMKHSILGRGYVPEDTFVRDVVTKSVRIHIESLQSRHSVDVNVEGRQFFTGWIGRHKVEMHFIHAGTKRYVVREIADPPLAKK